MVKVYINQGKDEIETTIKILEKAKPKIGEKVLIKPNLTMPYSSKLNICTSPKVIEGIIRYLKCNGIKDIIIGEGAGGAKNMSKHFKITGYKRLSDKLNIPLINLNKDKKVKKKKKRGNYLKEINIAKTVLDRYVINVPKMKTHRMSITTLSMKNMMGTILPYNKKAILHPLYFKFMHKALKEKRVLTEKEFKIVQEEFFKRLADFYFVLKPQLNIIDAFTGREGDGLTKEYGKSVKFGYVLLSESILAIDYVGTSLMDLKPFDTYLKNLKSKIKNIKIISNKPLNKIRKKFKPILLTEKIKI